MSWVDRGARCSKHWQTIRKHLRNASLIKRRRDPLEDFRDAHRSRAGIGPGRNASLTSSRVTCVSDRSGCPRRIRCLDSSRAKQAHLKRREQALFCRHGPLNLELDGLRQGACIADEHGQMLPRASAAGRIY